MGAWGINSKNDRLGHHTESGSSRAATLNQALVGRKPSFRIIIIKRKVNTRVEKQAVG